MKVIEIFENTQLTTAKEFKDSFDSTEWENIICYYITIMDRDVGLFSSVPLQDRPASMTQMAERMRSRIGPGMFDSVQPQAWRALSGQFGIKTQGSSWQHFYDVLKPHATHTCEIEYAPSQTAQNIEDTDIVAQLYTTQETLQDVLSWIPSNLSNPLIPGDQNSTLSQALVAMMNGAKQSPKATPLRGQPGPNDQQGNPTPSWDQWYRSTATSNNAIQPVRNILIIMLEKIPDTGCTKTELATIFLNFLRAADSMVAKMREQYK